MKKNLLTKRHQAIIKSVLCTLLSLSLIGFSNIHAYADTQVRAKISSDGIGDRVDNSTGNIEIVYKHEKNDTDNPYFFQYRATQDMEETSSLFHAYSSAMALAGYQWKTHEFHGEFTVQLDIDTQYVNIDENMVTPENVQKSYLNANSDTQFFKHMKCTSAHYDAPTLTATFELMDEAGNKAALGSSVEEMFDNLKELHVVTPENALYVKQSDFEVDKSFVLSNQKFSGKFYGSPYANETWGGGITIFGIHISYFSFIKSLIKDGTVSLIADRANPPVRITLDDNDNPTPQASYASIFPVLWDEEAPDVYIKMVKDKDAAYEATITAEDETIYVGDSIDPMNTVKAIDKNINNDEDIKDLTSSVELIDGKIDNTTPGEYVLTFRVRSRSGEYVTTTRTVTVRERTTTPEDEEINSEPTPSTTPTDPIDSSTELITTHNNKIHKNILASTGGITHLLLIAGSLIFCVVGMISLYNKRKTER